MLSGFESTSFYGWFGLLLAVQRQPVVVHIEATADTFKSYDGDPACFTYNLNHVVLLVGYRLVGKDSRVPHMAPPFWIIRNSWGPDWGDGGHMRMDIQVGDGVCGINSLPGLYPVVRVSSDPCYKAARTDTFGSLFNPCGKFTCIPKGKTNVCVCNDPRFIQATNADGSRTCAYKDACKAAKRNPCAVGTCVNDGVGSYSCVCPPGFRQGTTVDGTFSCAPVSSLSASSLLPLSLTLIGGDTRSQYTVLAPNIFCSDVYPPFGLSLEKFGLLNPAVDCNSDLRIGTVLSVVPNSQLVPCSVFYTTAESLNPGLSCSLNSGQLQPSQAVCVERRAASAAEQVIPVCSQYYLVQSGETCDSIRNVPTPALSWLDFFRFNPGIKCNRLVPVTNLDLHTGFEVRAVGVCQRSKAYVAGADDRCSSIQIRFFKSNRGCYKRINGYECLDKISSGSRICLPDQTRIRQGVCTV
ncbi:unnamed protein product [Closterium sp. Naga37s-1]|nr:unnamed protein product [Closterium sp. Naga37s-1]